MLVGTLQLDEVGTTLQNQQSLLTAVTFFLNLALTVKKEVTMSTSFNYKDSYVKTDRLGYLLFCIVIFALDNIKQLQIYQRSAGTYMLLHSLLLHFTRADGWLCWRILLFTIFISGISLKFSNLLLCCAFQLVKIMFSDILERLPFIKRVMHWFDDDTYFTCCQMYRNINKAN